jgi:hypothetical protein
MIIDTFSSGSQSFLQKHANVTSALLLSLFDVAHHRYQESVDEDPSDKSFEKYALQ